MLTTVPFYGVSLLDGHPAIFTFSPEDTLRAGVGVVISQTVAWVAFESIRAPRRVPRVLLEPLLRWNLTGMAPWVVTFTTGYLLASTFFIAISLELQGPLRAIAFGANTVALFLVFRAWGEGTLPRGQCWWITINLVLQGAALVVGLYLIGFMSTMALAIIGYISTSRRLPWLPLVVLLPLLALLHAGKPAMRAMYWQEGAPDVELWEVPAFITEWLSLGLEHEEERGIDTKSAAENLAERASLFHMLCLVVQDIPEHRPYLAGESYLDIPAAVVPRFLWPGKPSSLMSNVRLAVYFNLVDPYDPFSVSIAFGVLAEAYANFGMFGLIILGILIGWACRKISSASLLAPLFSPLGLGAILLTAWSITVEMTAATWLISFLQACSMVILLPWLASRFLGAR